MIYQMDAEGKLVEVGKHKKRHKLAPFSHPDPEIQEYVRRGQTHAQESFSRRSFVDSRGDLFSNPFDDEDNDPESAVLRYPGYRYRGDTLLTAVSRVVRDPYVKWSEESIIAALIVELNALSSEREGEKALGNLLLQAKTPLTEQA